MKIIDIRLTDFQGIHSMEINLDGRSAAIYGDNGTGKTTIFNAITWLLFDKPSTGAKNWSPKTRGADGEKHNLEHSVVATFALQDGSLVTLGKTLREVYKKKRGAAAAEYSGNTIDYYIDGVPVKEKEYTAAVAGYCGGDEMMKLLTMPDYFPEAMEWKKRRELLLEICGDVTDEAVIESNEDLADLPTYLLKPGTVGQYYTVEEYAKIARARKADINRQLDTLPDRIDEAQRVIPADLPSVDELKIELHEAVEETGACRRYIDAIQLRAGNATKTALADARAELAQAKADYTRRNAEAAADVREALTAISGEIRDAVCRADDARADAETKRRHIERMTTLRESILAEYREAAAETFDAGRETCPTCGRRLPEEQIEEMRADFNQHRSERLAAINARGKKEANKDMIAALEAEAQELDKQAAAADEEEQAARERYHETQKGLVDYPPFEETNECKAIEIKITGLEQAVAAEDRGMADEMGKADERLQACLAVEHSIRGRIIQAEAAEKQRARVAELEAQEKQLGEEFENVERGVYLCELFIKTKVGLLTDRINGKFSSVSFQLFTEQVNGGLSECCEVMVPGEGGVMVPYATANHAARVNAGLEIIDTIAAHYGQEMPVVVDNAESVTHLIDAGGQVIRLVVSEEDKVLRVEVAA